MPPKTIALANTLSTIALLASTFSTLAVGLARHLEEVGAVVQA